MISGVTLELGGITSDAARLSVTRDPSVFKANVKALVVAYNDFEEGLKILEDRRSTVPNFGGLLAGDNTVRTVRSELRNLLVSNSSSPGQTVLAFRDIGISLDRNGKMQLDESRFDKVAAGNFDEMVNMLTANQNNQSMFATAAGVWPATWSKSLTP